MPNPVLSSIAVVASFTLLIVLYYLSARVKRDTLPDYPQLSGVPLPKPLWDFDVRTAKARPYRPFRWDYHQTMSLKKFEPDFWLELESTYLDRLKQRKELYSQYKTDILDALPGSSSACVELAEMVIQFLCARYPRHFVFTPSTGIFNNRILEQEADTTAWRYKGAGEGAGIEALKFLMDHVPEDFLVTQENTKTGNYELIAGVVCSALGWTIQHKLGKPLHKIHGPVPDYKEKMEFSMNRFFSKMSCDKPIQRGSWGLEIGKPLFTPPNDPHLKLRETQLSDLKLEDIHLRVDWQTLRRLPISRAIIFNYKALFTPFSEFRNEPYIPRLVAKILRDGKEEIMKYKGTWHVEHRVLPALDQWALEQEEKGWVPKDWKERTLDEDPFFPGWDRC
ncbi:hypothetical protein E4T56_gene19449 [Termitomyces sp. T112]|nr:hypothetical protein C0989_002701 [Termitomyces sp. Mn162]KAG5728070.1 hypothetical protein E4T56_gene19449 [Termitomyces sp. T112]